MSDGENVIDLESEGEDAVDAGGDTGDATPTTPAAGGDEAGSAGPVAGAGAGAGAGAAGDAAADTGDGSGAVDAVDQLAAQIEGITKAVSKIQEETTLILDADSGAAEEALAVNQSGFNDAHSVYVGNVEYNTKPAELNELFQQCGTVMNITIPVNRYKQGKGCVRACLLPPHRVASRLTRLPLAPRSTATRTLNLRPRRQSPTQLH